MNNSYSLTAFKGLLIGSTMIIPGVSGGSMAMILGIYDRLISSVSSFRKTPAKNTLFLLTFSLSAGLGMLLFSNPLSFLLSKFPMETMYFFLGAVFGGIPVIQKKSRIERLSFDVLFYLLLGLVCVLGFAFLPNGLLENTDTNGWYYWLFLPAAGILAATALILPGISVSHFLLVLGLYEPLLTAFRTLNIAFFGHLGTGLLLGIFLFTKLLEHFMKKHPKQTYLTILGFILGSAAQIFPGIPKGWSFPICLFLACTGFVLVNSLSQKEA